MRYGYALCESRNHGSIGQWYETVHLMPVDLTTATMSGVERGLRPWALELLRTRDCRDAWYFAVLVELDEQDCFDSYDPLCFEDIAWFYGHEYVPAEVSAPVPE